MNWQVTILNPEEPSFPKEHWRALAHRPGSGHILQDDRWARLKSRFGWRARAIALQEEQSFIAGAMVLFRPLPGGFTIAYIPKGPIWAWDDLQQQLALLAAINKVAQQERAIALKIEPEAADTPFIRQRLTALHFQQASAIQPRATVHVDLAVPEETILARMKQKWRYNVRLAKRKGILVRPATATDLSVFYALMAETGRRDGFAVHSEAYYRAAYQLFVESGAGQLLLANYNDDLIAALFAMAAGDKGYYMYGASSGRERQRMPNHLLQWEAMRWAKAKGAAIYDLWGIPEEVGRGATTGTGGLWGVYRFKSGFGGREFYYTGGWDLVYNRLLYKLYRRVEHWRRRRR